MAKSKVAPCGYCGETRKTTREHVIPKCLFLRPYPKDFIYIYACEECNCKEKSLDDDFLRDLLTSDIYGNQHPIAKEIFQTKVLRSVKRGSSLVSRIMLEQGKPESFYSHGGIYLGQAPSAPLDQERAIRILSIIVRGLYFNARSLRIPKDYKFTVMRYHPREFMEMYRIFHERLHLHGPRTVGEIFLASYAAAQEDPLSTLWLLSFYDNVCFSVSAFRPDLAPPEVASSAQWGRGSR